VLRRALTLEFPPGTEAHPHAYVELYLGAALCSQRRFDECMAHLNRAVEIAPDVLDAYGYMGEAELSQGRAKEAVAYFERAIAVNPEAVSQLTRASWILATSSRDDVRDGARAVQYAEKAAALTHHQDVSSLDTLGAAYAETGQFDKAVAAVSDAIKVDAQQGGSVLTQLMQRHLALFQARRPLRTAGW
jgi:tetratricopeptide (TPR) repeat protein